VRKPPRKCPLHFSKTTPQKKYSGIRAAIRCPPITLQKSGQEKTSNQTTKIKFGQVKIPTTLQKLNWGR
jgi:hypothetical protein